MPEFHFTFGCINKEKKTKVKKTTISKPKKPRNKILHKNVNGLVKQAVSLRGGLAPSFDVDVTIDNRYIIVPIDVNAYDCRNVRIVYRYLNGGYQKYLREISDLPKSMPITFTPVKPGSHVIGDVVEFDNKLFFKVKKILK